MTGSLLNNQDSMGKYPRGPIFRGSLVKAKVLTCCLTQHIPSMFVWGTEQLHHKRKWLFRVSKRNWNVILTGSQMWANVYNTKTHSKWNYCGECCSLMLSYTSPEGDPSPADPIGWSLFIGKAQGQKFRIKEKETILGLHPNWINWRT